MTDQPAAAPPEQPMPLNNYEIKCLNGWAIRCSSPLNLALFWKLAKADGYISADKMAINFANIVSIEYLGPYVPPEGRVVQFGQPAAPIGQITHDPMG